MSEFSASYHLHSAGQADAVALLERSKCPGFAFPSSGDWSTFIAGGRPLAANKQVTTANEGTLLFYWNAEDHGWGFSLFDGPTLVVRFERDWEEDAPTVTDADLDALVRLVPGNATQIKKEETLRDILITEIDDTGQEETPPYRFAQLLGLENFSWLSYDNWLAEVRAGRSPYPGEPVGIQTSSGTRQAEPRIATSMGDDGILVEQEVTDAAANNELVGKWLVVGCETEGVKRKLHPIELNQFYEFTLDGLCIITNKRTKSRVEFRYRNHANASPKQLDRQWPSDEVWDLGIYKIDGDELSWCYQMHWYAKLGDLAERPGDFSTDKELKTDLRIMQSVPAN